MSPISSFPVVALCAAGLLAPLPAASQAPGPFASQVLSANTNGGAGGGIFAPANALGAPDGAFGVHSLGVAGDLTLGFATPITDGPGADLIVGENPFRVGSAWWTSFAEVSYVEVSSDGVRFARFPARYHGPAVQPGPFGSVPIGSYERLAGQHPVLAATSPFVDAQDVVDAGGDAFDLADLAAHPMVSSGAVDLQSIVAVRLVDVVSGVSPDATGAPIFDAGAGSADIDAVTAIHQAGALHPGTPSVALAIQPDGTMTLSLNDPDGWQDLDPTSLRAALFGVPVDAGNLLGAFQVAAAAPSGFTLVQPVPLPPGLRFTLSFSLKDLAGHRSGQSRARPGS